MYVELHARSAFSFLQGASLPEELAARCGELGMPALALLDHDGVYGAPRFYQAAKRTGIRALLGVEVSGTEGQRYALLAESRTGYQNLCRMLTLMKLRSSKGTGALALEELAPYATGLVCLTGGDEGPITQALRQGGLPAARHCLEALRGIFGGRNVYCELQRHGDRRQEARNQAIVSLARSFGAPLLATNGVCHATPAQRELFDVLTCIRRKTTLAQAGRLLARNAERYLKPPATMQRLFADLPEAIGNTMELSQRLQFTLADLGYEFPHYPVGAGETEVSFLRQRTDEGARWRYQPYHPEAQQQIERELALIEKLGFAGYFLIVWDLVRFCRENGILVQGRGSAANSAVCYALGITAVDPVKMKLLFERFLSEERDEWPDIDLDLPSGTQRERVIQYLYQRYGERGAAMTANVISYRQRMAAREVGKVLGVPDEMTGRLSALQRSWEFQAKDDHQIRRFAEAGIDLRQPLLRKYYELFEQIQDLPRHLGQHSGGMVICQGQLDSIVPLEPASMSGRVVVQWDKDDCASLGIIKVDLLGLGMMAVLEESLALIREHCQEEVDLAHLPQEDQKVYKILQKGDTVGMFQVESRAQMATLPRLKPTCFYDLVVEVAIIRPGPIVGKMVHPYLQRREHPELIDYPHPDLKPVLERTLGIPLFQEQLLHMAMIVAGFSGGEAEELRRAFGYKRSERRMKEVEAKLRAGMDRKGITGPKQETIVQSITSFALYGFPESHAASFALLAYASAYLKVYYLAAFTCAMLNCQPMGFYRPATLVMDAKRHGLTIRPVNVAVSECHCTLEREEEKLVLRLGLNYVRGLRADTARALVSARQRQPFASIADLAYRVRQECPGALRPDELRQLAAIGALNSLDPENLHRRSALWQSEAVLRPTGPLLEGMATGVPDSPLAAMTDQERMMTDYQGTNVNLGPHPMVYYRQQWTGEPLVRAADLHKHLHGSPVWIAGGVIVRQRPPTANGFFFLSLEDETGIANVIVEPELFEVNRAMLLQKRVLVVQGILQTTAGVISVKARQFQ